MELKELRELAADKYAQQYLYDDGREAGFVAGATWEFERNKWIEGETPPDSGRYLVMFLDHSIEVRVYRQATGWVTKYPVVKWAFIP